MASNQEMHSTTYLNAHELRHETVPAIPGKTWNTTVKRDGKRISALQELADSKTIGLRNAATLATLVELVSQLAGDREIDYEQIEAASKRGAEAAIREGVVTVDVNINDKEQP